MTTLKRLSLRIALECLVVGLLLAGTAAAQTFVGSIGGIVKDASGAVVPGVKVLVTDKSTNVSLSTETNGAGVYLVPFLQPSTYRVTLTKEGFKTDVEENVPLVLNQIARLDVALVVGVTTQSVTVTATAPQLDRETAVVGANVESSDLVKYPEQIGTGGPKIIPLIKIFPGMSGSSSTYSNPNSIAEAGGRTDTAPIITDGLPSNMGENSTYGFTPTPDSTGEMQVLITPYSAQYGQTGGGAVLTTTKAGTDNFHGALWEVHNDQSLNAVDFFSKHPFVKPEAIYNYFGGAVGGPVYIPGLWNGRKRHTFFFADVEDTISFKPGSLNTIVPTAAQRQGNFSGPEANGTTPPTNYIYDPSTTVVSGSTITRTPFAGNIITTPEDPVGAKIISYYPLPTPNTCVTSFNYCVTPPGYHSYLYSSDRVDQEVRENDRLWFRYAQDGPWGTGVPYIPNAANTSFTSGWRDYQASGTWVHIFSPTVTNEFRFGEVEEDNFKLVPSSDVSSLGLVNVPPVQFPSIGVGSGYYILGGGGGSTDLDRHQVINDALQMVRGRHTLHMGGEYMRYMNNQYNPGNLAGGYSFSGSFTSQSGAVAATGNGIADLYLGYVASASISTNNYAFRYRMNYAALYAEDSFKVTPKLTLHYGLRWEFGGPTTEVNNWIANLDPTAKDPTTGLPGAVVFAGRNGAPRQFMPNDYRGFLPRGEFAYDLGHNTVVRGGVGFFELPNVGYVTQGSVNEYTRNCSFTAANTYTPVFMLQSGIPNCPFNQNAAGLPNVPSSLTKPTQTVTEFQTHGSIPLMQEWSLSLQHQFPHGWMGEVDWVGNKGTHLPLTNLPMDQIVPTAGCCYTTSNAQSLRPFPQWNGVNYFSYSGNSNYNGLLTRMQHNWSHGLSALFTYTYAKSMDDVDGPAYSNYASIQNVYNIAAQYGLAMTDIPQRFTAAYVWQIPVGASGKLAAHTPVVNQILGHWEFSGITQFSKGYPYSISQSNLTGLFNQGQYTSRVSGVSPYLSNPTVAAWFNTAAFTQTAQNTFGTTPRAALFGPGLNNFDLSVARNFPIKERLGFQVRADFYNAFNHVQFSSLNTSLGNSSFGRATGDTGARIVQLDARVTF